jgi:hypothetical protein
MKDGQKIAKYNVEFTRLAAQVEWGDAPLRHAYYKGLPERIKDSLVHVLKPKSVAELRYAAQQMDIRYWERHNEKSKDQPSNPSKSDKHDKSDKTSDNRSNNKKSNGNSGSKTNNSNSGSSNNNSGNQKKSPDLSDKLRKDGKLTAQERQ